MTEDRRWRGWWCAWDIEFGSGVREEEGRE